MHLRNHLLAVIFLSSPTYAGSGLNQKKFCIGINKNEKESEALISKLIPKLINSNGQKTKAIEIGNPKYFAYYYSASWCGPCKKLTPEFIKHYEELKKGGVQIVLISQENEAGPKATLAYMNTKDHVQPWPAILPEDQAALGVKDHGMQGIPAMVIVDASGKVVERGYAQILIHRILQLSKGESANRQIKPVDKDGDGKFSFEEFSSGIASGAVPQVRQVFDKLDSDKDGFVTPAEVQANQGGAGLRLQPKDTDSDGKFTFEEFSTGVPAAQIEQVRNVFHLWDSDKDGKLTVNEIQAAQNHR
ncbi:MAG: hypothetical protein RL095_2412 [Verrucomicrobiota bacterium]